jgi:hypothetical protein
MGKQHIEPSIDLVSFSCPHCGALAHQTWFDVYADRIEEGAPHRETRLSLAGVLTDPTIQVEMRERLRAYFERLLRGEVFLEKNEKSLYGLASLENVWVSRCYSCEQEALWVADHVVYPSIAAAGVDPSPDLSDDIKRDFKEAASILNASPRGAAALLRLCIQKLCIEFGEPGQNLNDDIGRLVNGKGLDRHIQQALDIVRVVGNNAVHPGQIDLRDDRDTALKLFGLVNEIAEELITRPRRIEKLYVGVVPESARAQIAKRDGKPTEPTT